MFIFWLGMSGFTSFFIFDSLFSQDSIWDSYIEYYRWLDRIFWDYEFDGRLQRFGCGIVFDGLEYEKIIKNIPAKPNAWFRSN